MTEKYDLFRAAVHNLIRANELHRQDHDGRLHDLEPWRIAQEFGTVRVGVGRRAGKSKVIADYADPADLVLVPNSYSREYSLHEYPTLRPHVAVATPEALSRLASHSPFPRIWLDEPDLIKPALRDEIYVKLAKHRRQTFILLGTP